MILGFRVPAAVLALIWLASTPVSAGHTLTATQQKVLDQFLRSQPQFRPATDEDCACPGDIKDMRRGYGGDWAPVPDYHPYVATGDFNGDGYQDFAIVLTDTGKLEKKFVFVVFNGPFKLPGKPTFMETGLELTNQGLFFGPPRPRPYRLIMGWFESDNTSILEPKGKSYMWGHVDNGH